MDDGKPKLLDQLRQQIRVRNYSIRTEAVYAEWVKRYIRFHHYRHPAEMGAAEIEAFIGRAAERGLVPASPPGAALRERGDRAIAFGGFEYTFLAGALVAS